MFARFAAGVSAPGARLRFPRRADGRGDGGRGLSARKFPSTDHSSLQISTSSGSGLGSS